MSQATIPVARITPSPTNPRKHFDEHALQELADSIAKHGVLQAVLVRPMADRHGHFELVAGERRFRAAKLAKLAEIPATVRELSDTEVVEVQVVENLQRADLHPLEEADGYEALLKCQHQDGRPYTVEEIAAKVGKSKSYVYQRMRLASITGMARKAFLDGTLDAARALLIARIPDAKDQDEAFETIAGDYLMELTAARQLVQRSYMQGLVKPPFDVTAVYFHGGTRGAQAVGPKCGECPKRTLNQAALFEDMAQGDFCTDTKCFQAKANAHLELEAEKMRAKGRMVLTGEEAKQVFPNEWSSARGGYVGLDDFCYEPRLAVPTAKWSVLLKGLKAETVYVAHPREPGKFVKLVDKKDALELLEKAGMLKPVEKSKSGKMKNEYAEKQAETAKRFDIELAVHKAVRDAILADQRGFAGPLAEGVLRAIAKELWVDRDVDMEIQDLAVKDGKMEWQEMSEAELLAALVDAAIPYLDVESDLRRTIGKIYGIDAKAIAKQVSEQAKAAEKAAAKPKKPGTDTVKDLIEKKKAKLAADGPGVQIVPLIVPLAEEQEADA